VLRTGDLAFLHDLGGLLIAHRSRVALTVVVIQNDGGGIFSFLPIARASEHFEAFFGTPHGLELSHAAGLFGARYAAPRTAAELRAELRSGLEGGLHLLEVRVDRQANPREHHLLYARISEALGEGPWA
jgi:2-succinyl-5-enolpyruvyl-6-hydroxy-3-cyclohexene-1-carboxylate synthase